MGIVLTGAVARHERRIRLVFSQGLAAAALTRTTFYSVVGADGSPVPVAGIVLIVGEPSAVDLALGSDLAGSVTYTVRADGVPALDGSVTQTGSTLDVRLGASLAKPNVEVQPDDVDALLYGIDLVWTGTDYAETPAGDLASIGGPPNVQAALERRLTSEGLPWDDTYGAKPRAYLDGAPGALSTLRGALVRQASADDRVKLATCSFNVADDSASADFDVQADLIGEGDAINVSVTPNAGT